MSKAKVTNPKIIGPGWWTVLHIMSREAFDEDGIDNFYYFIEVISAQMFPCVDPCRKHIQEHLTRHPLGAVKKETYRDQEVGYFKWGWEFHNIVNNRLGKPELTFEEAFELFYGTSSTCEKNCAGNSPRAIRDDGSYFSSH